MQFPQAAITLGRALNLANLPDTWVGTPRGEFTDDDEGGGTYEDGETVTFACRVSPLNAKEMETLVADQLRQPGLEKLVFAVGQELAVTDTGTVTKRDENGDVIETYPAEVVGIVPDPTYVMLRRAVIKRIDTEEEEGS